MKDGINKSKRTAKASRDDPRMTAPEVPRALRFKLAFTKEQIRKGDRWSTKSRSLQDMPISASEVRLLLTHLRRDVTEIFSSKEVH